MSDRIHEVVVDDSAAMLREEIALSWKRSLMSGLMPTDSIDDGEIADVDRRSRLLDAASPVLDRMQQDLSGTGFCVLLADRDARLVDLRFGRSGMQDLMAGDGAIRGRRFAEDTTGTNSIATVFETRMPLAVRGTEHYVEAMKKFSCYGYPLTHPVTRRLEGVLDITFLATDDNPLLQPMLRHAAADVQQRLLEGARESEKQLLGAFQDTVARHRGAPVLALADDVLLANASAQDLLDPIDHAVLKVLTAGAPVGVDHSRNITLNSGTEVRVGWRRITRAGGVVIDFRFIERASRGLNSVVAHNESVEDKLRRIRRTRTPVMIFGESGTGRTTCLMQLASREETVLFHGSDPGSTSASAWLAGVRTALESATDLVIVEDIHMLPAPIARRLSELLADTSAWFALSAVPGDHDRTSHYRQLSLRPLETIELEPLRARSDRIPGLIRSMSAELDGPGSFRFTAAALAALAARPWPGNVSELRDVVASAIAHRSVGDITESDVGGTRHDAPSGKLTRLEQAERTAIRAALVQYRGNKSETAAELGISRTTLYKRMKAFGISG